VKELPDEIVLLSFPVENPVNPKVLCSDVRGEIFPLRMVGILRRFSADWAHMAKSAGHSHPVRPHQLLILVICFFRVVAIGIPIFCRRVVEIGIGKETQTHDAGFISIKRTHRKIRAVDFRATRNDLDSWIVSAHLQRGRVCTPGGRLSSHNFQRSGSGPVACSKQGSLTSPNNSQRLSRFEIWVNFFQFRMRGEYFQKIQRSGAVVNQLVPQAVVTRRPYQPGVASPDQRRLCRFPVLAPSDRSRHPCP